MTTFYIEKPLLTQYKIIPIPILILLIDRDFYKTVLRRTLVSSLKLDQYGEYQLGINIRLAPL